MLDTNEEKNGYRWAIVFVLTVYKAFLLKERKAKYSTVDIEPLLRIHLFHIADDTISAFSHLLYQLLYSKLKCAFVYKGFEEFDPTITANPTISFDQTFPGKSQTSFETSAVPVPSWHESLYFFDSNHLSLRADIKETSTVDPLQTQFTTPIRQLGGSKVGDLAPPKPLFSPETTQKTSYRKPLLVPKQDTLHAQRSQQTIKDESIFASLKAVEDKRAEANEQDREKRRQELLAIGRKVKTPTVAFLEPATRDPSKVSAVSLGEETTCSYLVIAYESREETSSPQYIDRTLPQEDVITQKARYGELTNFTVFKSANYVLNHLRYLAIGYSQSLADGSLMHETVDLKNNLLNRSKIPLRWNAENGCIVSTAPGVLNPLRTASYHFGKQRLAIGHCNMCAVLAICMGARKICLNLDSSSTGWFDSTNVSTFAFHNYEENDVLKQIVTLFRGHFENCELKNSELTLPSNAAHDKGIRKRWYQGAAFAVKELLEGVV